MSVSLLSLSGAPTAVVEVELLLLLPASAEFKIEMLLGLDDIVDICKICKNQICKLCIEEFFGAGAD